MNNKTVGIIATVISALVCGCAAIFACIWGVLIATNTPLNVTSNGVQSVQTLPAPVGFVLLCLSVLLILVPAAVGFFTLRNKKPAPAAATAAPGNDEPLPPAS